MIDATPSILAAEKVSISALMSFLRTTGWTARPSHVEGISILSKDVPGATRPVQFILPARAGFSDEHRRIADALRTIAAIEGRSEESIAQEVRRYAVLDALRVGTLIGSREPAKGATEGFEITREMDSVVREAHKAFDVLMAAIQKASQVLALMSAAQKAGPNPEEQDWPEPISSAEGDVAPLPGFAQGPRPRKAYDEVARAIELVRWSAVELQKLAGRAELDTLAFLLEMVILEADECLRRAKE